MRTSHFTIMASLETLRLNLPDDVGVTTERITIFNSIFDIFKSLSGNLSTFLKRGFMSFKRSELKLYTDQKRSTLNAFFEDEDPVMFARSSIPIPGSSTHSYKDVVTALTTWTVMDVNDFLKDLTEIIDDLIGQLQRRPEDVVALNEILSKASVNETYPTPDKIRDMVTMYFPTLRQSRPPAYANSAADILASSKAELLVIHEDVLKWNTYFENLADASSSMRKLDQKISSLVDLISDHKHSISKEFIESFISFTHEVAQVIEGVGIIAEHCQHVEHNYVQSLKILVEYEKNK